tara:strand:- start:1220 stop:2635 length:1416 start_codon:yes stop_codon:yes gene_type:complete
MKITISNKKGLSQDIKVFIDKASIEEKMNAKYEEIKDKVVIKGFRPGKVPKTILKQQFGKSIYGEVLDKVLKETSTKVLEDKKIKPAGQPKIDLKTFGEDKDLEYVISVTELPKVELKSIENIKIEDYTVKIDPKETDKRIKEIAKNQSNFKEKDNKISEIGDLVAFDYKATIDEKPFENNEGKNTQIVLGKDLFIKGFDDQLKGVKKGDNKNVKVTLPESYPQKQYANKKANFNCSILTIKEPAQTIVDDQFAKNLGAKDLEDLKKLISKQIKEEYKNSLDMIVKNKILKEIEKFKVEEIPQNLVDQEVKILSQGMKEDEIKKNKKDLEERSKKRIKVGLILNAFGEDNKVQVNEKEIQAEVQKQLAMMPGQEKIVIDYYKENPAATDGLRGQIYENKIIDLIKSKVKLIKKDVTKDEAEKLIKAEHESHQNNHDHESEKTKKIKNNKTTEKTSKTLPKKAPKKKKVSKK